MSKWVWENTEKWLVNFIKKVPEGKFKEKCIEKLKDIRKYIENYKPRFTKEELKELSEAYKKWKNKDK